MSSSGGIGDIGGDNVVCPDDGFDSSDDNNEKDGREAVFVFGSGVEWQQAQKATSSPTKGEEEEETVTCSSWRTSRASSRNARKQQGAASSSLVDEEDPTCSFGMIGPVQPPFSEWFGKRPEPFVSIDDGDDGAVKVEEEEGSAGGCSTSSLSSNGGANASQHDGSCEDDDDDDSTPSASPCAPHYFYRSASSAGRLQHHQQQEGPSSSSSLSSAAGSLSYQSLQDLLSSAWLDYTPEELALPETPTSVSDLSAARTKKGRHVWIVTTASLPWMTGTAVNPLLRAAALCSSPENDDGEEEEDDDDDRRRQRHRVTLVLPWLECAEDRVTLYDESWRDATEERQESYIRDWLRRNGLHRAALELQLDWYPARYHPLLSSVFAMGDVCERIAIPDGVTDAVCLLEEPEHVNFYRAPGVVSWRQKFAFVVGIVHTNYKAYARQYSGIVAEPIVGALSAWMVQAYCDKVIKLSAVLQQYAPEKEVVCNVHGIRQEFLDVRQPTANKVYFLGKLLWAKGLDRLLDLQYCYKRKTGGYFDMDIYGSGPEEAEIRKAFVGNAASGSDNTSTGGGAASAAYRSYARWTQPAPMPVSFPGRKDHAQISSEYKIFVNPSVTEVLCTTTAEAVAMGKFVVIPVHPSNEFFAQFPNCLQYKNKHEFCQFLQYALQTDPQPLNAEHRHMLTWQAATDRFLEAAAVSERDAARRERLALSKRDERVAKLHYELGRGYRGDVLRKVMGGGPVADQHKYTTSISGLSSTTTREEEVC